MAPVMFAVDMGVHHRRDFKKIKEDLMVIPGTYILQRACDE